MNHTSFLASPLSVVGVAHAGRGGSMAPPRSAMPHRRPFHFARYSGDRRQASEHSPSPVCSLRPARDAFAFVLRIFVHRPHRAKAGAAPGPRRTVWGPDRRSEPSTWSDVGG